MGNLPGTSGVLTPFGKIKGLMFNDKPEPDNFLPEFIREVRKKMEDDGVNVVGVDFGDDMGAYYDIMLNAEKFAKENLRLKITSRDQPEIIIEHEDIEINMDDTKNKSIRSPKDS